MEASRRLRSTSRSPGTPTTNGRRSPPSTTAVTTTHLSVSAAVHGSPSRGASWLATSTSAAMVVETGVSLTSAAGRTAMAASSSGAGATVVTASTLARLTFTSPSA